MLINTTTQKTMSADFIHHRFTDLVNMVNQPTATPTQLIESIQALEKMLLEQMGIEQVLPSITQEKSTNTPLEQDLLQSLQDIENGDIEIIDETYFVKMQNQPVTKNELLDSEKDIVNQAVTIYE